MKYRTLPKQILQIRDDVLVNIDTIDSIIKTNKDPKDGKDLDTEIYVVFLKNSKYNWIAVSIDDFNKLIKPYI